MVTPTEEAAAKAAWLAKLEAPSWGPPKADAGSTSTVPADGVSSATTDWYYTSPHQMRGRSAFEPAFGDNVHARRSSLSRKGSGVALPTNAATNDWYFAETHKKMKDQFEPAFGDNTYSNRKSLGSRRA